VGGPEIPRDLSVSTAIAVVIVFPFPSNELFLIPIGSRKLAGSRSSTS
jgi:hypothetical protein